MPQPHKPERIQSYGKSAATFRVSLKIRERVIDKVFPRLPPAMEQADKANKQYTADK